VVVKRIAAEFSYAPDAFFTFLLNPIETDVEFPPTVLQGI
jgi:hypothetical protein